MAGLLVISLAGCRTPTPTPGEQTPSTTTQVVSATPEPLPTATSTPEPMALTVNGVGVPLAEYEAQLKQLQAADADMGKTPAPEEQRQQVLDELVNQTLLAQAAYDAGFTLDDAGLQQRIEALTADLGGQSALEAWITDNGYTPASFQSAMRRAAASAWQRDSIINAVPDKAEQVRAQQILVRSSETADSIYRQLKGGIDFATLATNYDPITSGVLGWFPRGYLTQPAVEEAAFALQPGEFSPVIQTSFGYHIIYVSERENDRLLSADARLVLQHKALDAWLKDKRAAASIQVLVP